MTRSPDSVAAAKQLFQDTWTSSEDVCLETETNLQKQLLTKWNTVNPLKFNNLFYLFIH